MTLIPFDDRDGFIWYDGAMVPWREAKLHVLSHGLHYASSVFEGERAYNGKVFKLREHTERLEHSANLLGFKLPYDTATLEAATNAVLKANNITDGYIRPVAWRGSEQMAVAASLSKVHVAIAAWVWPAYFKDGLTNGIAIGTSRWARPSPQTAPTASKAAGLYMIATMSKHEAEAKGLNDALMLDYRGLVAECTGANIFFVMQGALHTPTPDCFLDGITRRTIIDLARQQGLSVIERAIKPDEIGAADEVFICGTAAEVTPIRQIDGHNYKVGPITRGLMEAYAACVRR
jgi:branched-chain amino acid aminotransferase